MGFNIDEWDDDWVESDDPRWENFDADEEIEPLEDPDDWYGM